MFAAVDEALARLYPTRRWGERDEASALDAGVTRDEGEALAEAIGKRMKTLALYKPGGADEWCDYIYVLCLGRTPAIVEMREGQAADFAVDSADTDVVPEDGGDIGL
ncbi:MAG: hypothetical protein H7X95_08335, partial [Deltaproteobacteria bacterium]|nr:hypothetical protein [Deltaproteobacteria bacterium]